MSETDLGKLESIHPTSPVYLQRAAILAALSFVFFLAMLIAFSVWKNLLYFLLATAFLIVQLFTLFGWFMQRKNELKMYENGFKYKKHIVFWNEIEAITAAGEKNKSRAEIKTKSGERIILTDVIANVEAVIENIKRRVAVR